MNILDKIRDFNWLRFNDIGAEVSKLADSVKGIATDARKLGKNASAEDIAGLITRIKSLKDGTTIDELLGKLLGQAESVFDEHADERAELLKTGQKQSDDLDAPQDTPKPPPNPTRFDPAVGDVLFPYFPDPNGRLDRDAIDDAIAKHRVKTGSVVYGNGDAFEDSTLFTVWAGPGSLGRQPGSPWIAVKTIT